MKIKPVRSVRLYPFDHLPCAYVEDCDDALSLVFGFNVVEDDNSCPRAVYKVRKK